MKKNLLVAQSGGPTAAINATLAGVIKQAIKEEQIDQVYGACYGIQGVLEQKFVNLTEKVDTEEKLEKLKRTPAAALGSCRFKLNDIKEDDSQYQEIVDILHKMNIGYFVYIGGNDSMDTVGKMSRYVKEHQMDVKVIGIPKTIDNDIYGTDMTFGFQSAVDIATDTIDRIHTTATSHSRVFIIEVMGHKVGHVTLHAGIAGGADVILLPEIPYDIKAIKNVIDKRTQAGKRFTILAVAEGAISKEDAELPKKKYKEKLEARAKKYPSVSYEIADQIFQEIGSEVRVTVPGHMQRGGSPSQFDRVLASQLGAAAVDALMDDQKSIMLGIMNKEIVHVPFNKTIKHTKNLNPELLNLVRILSI